MDFGHSGKTNPASLSIFSGSALSPPSGSRIVLLRPTPLREKIDPVHMDEALAQVRGAARARVLTSASN